ncbi:MAG TPA: ester cyclase [Phycisphaerae bacterium]|nr:ester cyclase [Phycisphaerae bacterium]HRW52317.1 ester cyclase [Phycisphaerae bacterium]
MAQRHERTLRFANSELIDKHNPAAIPDVFAEDYVVHAEGRTYRGHAFIRRWLRQLRTAIPDLRVVDVTILAAKGHTIAWRRTLRGTHKAPLKRIPPSHRKVTWNEMLVTRFDGPMIVEEWCVSELAGQLFIQHPGR